MKKKARAPAPTKRKKSSKIQSGKSAALKIKTKNYKKKSRKL